MCVIPLMVAIFTPQQIRTLFRKQGRISSVGDLKRVKQKSLNKISDFFYLVRVKRLELLWVAPLEPKSSASTSFAIPAKRTANQLYKRFSSKSTIMTAALRSRHTRKTNVSQLYKHFSLKSTTMTAALRSRRAHRF